MTARLYMEKAMTPTSEDLKAAIETARQYSELNENSLLSQAKKTLFAKITEAQKAGRCSLTLATRLLDVNGTNLSLLKQWAERAGVKMGRVFDQRDGDYWNITW